MLINGDLKKIEFGGDCEVGMFLTISPKTFFLVEDDKQICGYIAAVPDNKHFTECVSDMWLPTMKTKHDFDTSEDIPSTPENCSTDWKSSSASHIVVRTNQKLRNECVFRRMLNSVLSVLKTSGATVVYHKLSRTEDSELFLELGFFPVNEADDKLLWRSL